MNKDFVDFLKEKALWVRKETLEIHRNAQGTRIASSLSPVEMLVALYYGKLLKFDASNLTWEGRDRFIVSKGHGSISLYPILADVGYFKREELSRVGKQGSFLGEIPDPIIPGYETVNGSLGHGLGVACGVALALKRKRRDETVFVLLGDGELYEGSVWEGAMLAGQHRLDNIIVLLDNNKICMLDFCKNIIDMSPIEDKFRAFRWKTETIEGHDVEQAYGSLTRLKEEREGFPKLLVANTVKGKGVPELENDPLCHIKNIRPENIDRAIEGLR